MGSRPRIAWFSALDPTTQSGYFTQELLPLIEQKFEVDLFVDDFEKIPQKRFHYTTALSRHRRSAYDLFFYQLEDTAQATFARVHIGLMPGVALFHDLLFKDPGPPLVFESKYREIAQKFYDPARPWFKEREGPILAPKGYNPFGLRECSFSPIALFTNPSLLAEFKANVDLRLGVSAEPKGDWIYPIPFPVSATAFSRTQSTNCCQTLAFCGSPAIEHRAHKLLQAISELKAQGVEYKLLWLIAEKERGAAQELLAEFNVDAALVTERCAAAWQKVLGDADLALHPHFSVYGQLGPYLQISLAAGVPPVLLDIREAEFLPSDLCFKIEPGAAEATQLRVLLTELWRKDLSEVGFKAREYARQFESSRVGAELIELFFRGAPYLTKVMSNFDLLCKSAKAKVLSNVLEEFSSAGDFKDRKFDFSQQIFQELGWL